MYSFLSILIVILAKNSEISSFATEKKKGDGITFCLKDGITTKVLQSTASMQQLHNLTPLICKGVYLSNNWNSPPPPPTPLK